MNKNLYLLLIVISIKYSLIRIQVIKINFLSSSKAINIIWSSFLCFMLLTILMLLVQMVHDKAILTILENPDSNPDLMSRFSRGNKVWPVNKSNTSTISDSQPIISSKICHIIVTYLIRLGDKMA